MALAGWPPFPADRRMVLPYAITRCRASNGIGRRSMSNQVNRTSRRAFITIFPSAALTLAGCTDRPPLSGPGGMLV